ncbi:MAG: methionine--tRNA ligase [Proteobacteria bacterium]|nr:methionine--tRNA ligase [Pseudomonadota bacterium]
MTPPFYLTTPIYYVNDVPHLGHAYTTVVGDTLARYHRSRGEAVRFQTGTDEHGQKIEAAAAARNLTPLELADEVVSRFRSTWQALGIEHDDFLRTTEPRHAAVVQRLWQRLADHGDLYLGEYDGPYCVACEEYYTDTQLVNGRCPVHAREVSRLKQTSYFFRMSRYQDALLEHFERHPDFVQPEMRRNEIVNFIRGGLRDLSVSRSTLRWGIRVPGDDSHVIYVWIDALTNYISALGGFDEAPAYRQFWPQAIHLIGKDILRFHAVYWPCMLLAAGLPLPRTVFAHGWWTVNGQKMSKSLMNAVDPTMLAGDLGRDALRYFLLRETPLGNDGDFAHPALIQRLNADLANDLGNLLNRSLAMAGKYCAGKTPALLAAAEMDPTDQALVALAERVRDAVAMHFERLEPSRALEALWELVRGTNKYIDTTAPYKLARNAEQQPRLDQVVAHFLEALRWISILLAPALPDSAATMRRYLGLPTLEAQLGRDQWPTRWGDGPPAAALQRGEPLFPRIDDERREALVARWTARAAAGAALAPTGPVAPSASASAASPTAAVPPKPPKPPKQPKPAAATGAPATDATEGMAIGIEDFARCELRVAEVRAAARIDGADRLLRLTLDVGGIERQVVSGIARAYGPDQLVGKRVILLANLKATTIRGVRSEGMILAAGDGVDLALCTVDRALPSGAKVS